MEWILPIETFSEANGVKKKRKNGKKTSEHWSDKKKRHDYQKFRIAHWWIVERPEIILPCTIKLTRVSPRTLDDDNLPMTFKWIRDAIADQIHPGLAPGRADDDKNINWQYDQEKGKPKSIKIQIFLQSTLSRISILDS